MPRIIHIHSSYHHPKVGDAKRHSEARASWYKAYKHSPDVEWVHAAVPESATKRNAATITGHGKPLPFIKDYVDAGLEMAHAQPSDLFAVCNDDCAFAENIEEDILQAGIGWCSRKDFIALPRRITKQAISTGSPHPGCDLFFMPVSKWAEVRKDFPDFIHGLSRWDLVMMAVLKKHGGQEIFNCIAHSMHPQAWLKAESEPGGLWNIKLFEEWETANGRIWDFDKSEPVK